MVSLSSVRYSAWGEEVETTYGGFWDGRSDVEGEHAVQLGLSSDPASDRQLFGQIAQLMVGDRLVCVCVCVHAHVYVCACVCVCMHVYVCTCVCVCEHSCMHCVCVCMHACVRACVCDM